jgi:PAS domain S-box-containing protein
MKKALASGSGGRSIATDLRLLVVAAVLPLVGVVAWGIQDRLEHDLDEVAAVAGRLARFTATDAERFLRINEKMLAAAAGLAEPKRAQPDACDAPFEAFSHLSSFYRGYVVSGLDGRVLCSGLASGARLPDGARFPLPPEAALPRFWVGNALPDPAAGGWIVPMHIPLKRDGGGLSGSVAVRFDMAHFQPIVAAARLPGGTYVGLVDAAGKLLAYAGGAGKAGQGLPAALDGSAAVSALRGRGDGVILLEGPDGPFHLGHARVADTGWLAFAAMPTAPAYTEARARALSHALAFLTVLALALVLAALTGRRILRPLRLAARTARQAAAGNLGVRLSESGPGEVAAVAARFNRLLDTVDAEQKQFRENEARLRDVLDLSGDWYWEQDAEQRLTRVEGNAYRFADVRKEVIGKRRQDIPGYVPVEGGWARYEAILARREPFLGMLFRQVAPDGRVRLLRVSGRPAFDATGEFIGYHGVAADATEEMANRQALLDSEARYRDLFDKNRRINLLVEPGSGRILDASEAACAFFGHSRVALTLMTLDRLGLRGEVDALVRDRADASSGIAFSFRPPGHNEVVLEAFPGRVEASGRNLLFITFHDITARKHAEAELRKLVRAVEQSPASIIITDTRGNIEYVNPRFEEVTGYAREEVVGRNPRFLQSGRTPPEVYAQLWQAITSGGEWRGELCNRTRQGDLFWEQASISAVLDEDGRVAHYLAVKENITGRKRSEAEISELNASLERRVAERTAELERANRELDAFSYSVSHDLRAPLRAINGFAHLIGEGAGAALDAENRALLERIKANAVRMGELIDEMLRFARAGRGSLDLNKVSLGETAAEVVRELLEQDPRVTVDIGPLPEAVCDPALIKQVFANLVGNAFKYSSKQTAPKVEIGAGAGPDGRTAIFVRDNGAGFDPQFAQRLFGMFQRLHSDKEFPGTGVGLAICKRIVERHGGRIWAESAPGAGATFFFTLGEAQ